MAGTIDELNFKVILDDKDFDAKVKNDIKLARDLNTSLSTLLDLKKQIGKFTQDDVNNNRKAQQILKDNARAQEAITREKLKTKGVQEKINAQIDRATKGYQTQSRILNELKGYALGYLSVHGATQLLSSLIRVTGEFELQKTTLSAMLGDLNAAEQVITKIQGLAVESPFQFKELTTYAKQLSAFSVPAQELYDTTKMLADISAGLGVGMDRIVLAYGQVRSAAFLRGQEVRQFTEAGIPILDELAKQFEALEGRAVSAGEVFDKISARLVPFEMVAKVFKDMTSEGGKFYNMQEVQAETLRGKISNLKDAYEVMLNEIGKGQSENLKGAVDWLRRLMQNYEDVGKSVLQCVVTFGVMKTATEVLSAAMGKLAVKNIGVIHSLRNIGAFAAKNPYSLIAAGLTAAGIGIYKWATQLEEFEKVQKSVSDTSAEYYKSLAVENSKLDTLYAKLELAKEGTEEYAEARKQIFSQYSQYISQLKDEGVEVSNLADIYDNLKGKIEESQRARFRDIASQDIEQTYGEASKKLLRRTERKIKGLSKDLGIAFNELEKQALLGYVTGSLSEDEIKENDALDRIKYRLAFLDEIKEEFKDASEAYADGLKAIDSLYGKEDGIIPETPVFQYEIEDTPKGKSPAQKAIEEQIKSVQKLQSAYEKLLPYLDEAQLKSTLKTIFPEIDESVIVSLDFRGELEKLSIELEKFDKDAAKRLRETVGKDVAGEIADSFRAMESYKKMLDTWLGEDFDLSGDGVSFDISKVIRDLNNEYAAIDQKRIKALNLLSKAEAGDAEALKVVREKYGEQVWQKYVERGREVIEELARLERDSARKTSEEKIRDLANRYVAEKMSEMNINLSDFGDKNINQIRTILERLREMVINTKVEMDNLHLGGLDEEEKIRLEGLLAVLDILEVKINDTSEELDKKIGEKIASMVDDLSGIFGEIGEEMRSLGDDIDNRFLTKVGGTLKEYSDFAKDISSSIKDFAEETRDIDFENTSFKDLSEGAKGGVIGIIAAVVSSAYKSIKNLITGAYEQQRMLNDASVDYAETLKEIRRQTYTGIFGTDEMGEAAENAKILTEAMDGYSDALDKFNEVKFRGQKIEGQGYSLGRMSVADIMGDISESQGWDLYLENGELNIDALEAYYDAYSGRLTKKQRDLVAELIESGNAVNDAAAMQAEYLVQIFSDAAEKIASDMVSAFIASGDAAVDMREYVSEVAKQMAADLIKTLYLMPILNDYASELKAITSDDKLTADEKTVQALNVFKAALGQIELQSDAINSTLGDLENYFSTSEDEATTELGEGIRGITEDQANLLASYLNAIRADVSYSKTLWVKMDANLQRIADLFTSSPSLMEYQAQIAANTFNTAQSTQEILSELRSVITTESGDTAVRVYS